MGRLNKMQRQGMSVTIQELRTLADNLEQQINELIVPLRVNGLNQKFQINIVNEDGSSDGWKIEH